ncbi:MAG: hypothetical protein LKG27_05605 [Clostridiaceae bacterium]|jgi:hypothetical protein|nr:hypothetical protein [Clostridiaceae bacterium]
MKIEYENSSITLDEINEKNLVSTLSKEFDKFNDDRVSQLNDIKIIQNSIYNINLQPKEVWNSHIELPDLYELAQTLKSHISENLYSNPESMFDVAASSQSSQMFANRQKAMLVDVFEKMNLKSEMEKMITGIVETGETTFFVGWETRVKQVRRLKTLDEQLMSGDEKSFVLDNKVVYDNPKIKFISPENFVFDKENFNSWDSCKKFYRTYLTLDDVVSDTSNNFLTNEKIEILKEVVESKKQKENWNKLEIVEIWGDVELSDGTLLKNWLIVLAGRKEIIRFESNPYVINPFIHANIIENPYTKRGISPLRVALILNNISSTILNKQIDALALMINPPYLAPKGCFKGEQVVKPGKIIEYDSALMPQAPTQLNFEKAMVGWDFLNYFKNTIESATGIFKNMSGNIQSQMRTATELNYSANGQEARLNMLLDSISQKIIIPVVEKTAEIIADFKLGKELIMVNDRGKTSFVEITDDVRNGDYIYRYGDRKASITRKLMLKELFEVVKSFATVSEVAQNVDWLECFKYALEQYGIENVNNFLVQKGDKK